MTAAAHELVAGVISAMRAIVEARDIAREAERRADRALLASLEALDRLSAELESSAGTGWIDRHAAGLTVADWTAACRALRHVKLGRRKLVHVVELRTWIAAQATAPSAANAQHADAFEHALANALTRRAAGG